jgi:hypothetical protein
VVDWSLWAYYVLPLTMGSVHLMICIGAFVVFVVVSRRDMGDGSGSGTGRRRRRRRETMVALDS